jgi:hypothetical protein
MPNWIAMQKGGKMRFGLFIGLMAASLVLCFAGTVGYIATGGWKESLSVDQHSSGLPDDSAKIAFLKKYLRMESEIEGAEFHIQTQDNSQGLVPAPSDCYMDVVMKMAPGDVPRWTAGLTPSDDKIDLSWGHALLREHGWTVNGTPAVFVRGRTIVAAFEAEGVVFKRLEKY